MRKKKTERGDKQTEKRERKGRTEVRRDGETGGKAI